LHCQVKDLELKVTEEPDRVEYPELKIRRPSDLIGNFCMEGTTRLEYVTVDFPEEFRTIETFAQIEIPEEMKTTDSEWGDFLCSYESLMDGWSLSNPPIELNFKLRGRCDGESVKDLVMDLSYDLDGKYMVALWFTGAQEEFIVGPDVLKEIMKADIVDKIKMEDVPGWERLSDEAGVYDSQSAEAFRRLPLEIISDTEPLLRMLQQVMRIRSVNIQYRDWNILGNTQFAVKTYEHEKSDTEGGVAFFGKLINITSNSRLSTKIRLELLHNCSSIC